MVSVICIYFIFSINLHLFIMQFLFVKNLSNVLYASFNSNLPVIWNHSYPVAIKYIVAAIVYL